MLKRCFLVLAALVAVSCAARGEDEEEYYIPNPLAEARVGDWVRYVASADGHQEQRMTVVGRQGEGDELKITVKYEVYSQGKLLASNQTVHGVKDFANELPESGHATVTVDEEEVTIKGKPVACTVVHIEDEARDGKAGRTREWYLSDDIPIYGVVKQVENGENTSSLIDYGFAERKE